MRELHLDILCDQFTKRNIYSFTRICQKLPSDVKNSEMKEICEIVKMFKADEIYNKGLSFILSNMYPNINVPDNKYDGSDRKTYLIADDETKMINHDSDISDADFDNDNNSYQTNFYKNQPKNEESSSNNETKLMLNKMHINSHAVLYQIEFCASEIQVSNFQIC